MLKNESYDVVVIGSGPGGEGAAMQAVKEGMSVALVERTPRVGGNCTHLGTIPSKALRQIAYRMTLFQSDPFFAEIRPYQNISFQDMVQRTEAVIGKQVALRSGHYQRNHIRVVHGLAKLRDANTVYVDEGFGPGIDLSCRHIVLATGSRPCDPAGIDMSHPRIYNSDSILGLESDPRIVTIVGAGVVGCEYTSIFRALGKKVNLINSRPRLLNFLDNEIIDAISYHLRDKGVLVRNNETMERVETCDDSVVLHLESGKRIRSDIIFFAMGRIGNIESLGITDLGMDVTERGHIKINERYQTSIKNIYAVGDLTGFPSLASSAYDQGRFAARHIADEDCDDGLVKDIPVGIYTSPEISCIGKTEAELTRARIPFEVGHASFKHLARAQITGQGVGMLKLLFHCETLEILGIHCFGHNAAEIIHIGQAIMAQKNGGNSLKYFIETTFNYPTMAEAYRVAALNGLNRLA